ncbi:hypothetical protein QTP86_014429 [Hemibagrus guttatus]|nr:hypothetical protein QTP86_014429 [Hemibagrus guttatus]
MIIPGQGGGGEVVAESTPVTAPGEAHGKSCGLNLTLSNKDLNISFLNMFFSF